MGVLNVTPDSFSDGGQYDSVDVAVQRALEMVRVGATMIDVGGESTRPGAKTVSITEELERVIPVIESLHKQTGVVISIDTSKPQVMKEAVSAGASLINDVYALRQNGALEMAASLQVPVCLMHMQLTPKDMQNAPSYTNILNEVDEFFGERIVACERHGISKGNIILDPGFGFGKALSHNLTLLANLSFFEHFDCVILAGLSRKSMLGLILDKKVDQRLAASVSAAVIAASNGASIVRVHDVEETVDAIRVLSSVKQYVQQ
ncbi:MAG: dihydropteroate synthase [Piscirickettsiaceae bacterium]|nr:MAG: dihydropteroate synthase [Piscirickettsiaceae bacterium]PCI68122.1 MAG: dihydropteroate synthase [Piscirickettsiaceae bacterium]